MAGLGKLWKSYCLNVEKETEEKVIHRLSLGNECARQEEQSKRICNMEGPWHDVWSECDTIQ